MTNKNSSLPMLLAAALFAGAPISRGEDNSGHSHGHHPDHAAEAGEAISRPIMSSHDGMTALYGHIQEIEKALVDGNLSGIHDHAESMEAAMKDLEKDTTLTPQKRTRVQGYVKNVNKLAHKLHDYADAKKVGPAKKEFEKLKAQVDLLDKQFAHSHKPGAAKATHPGETKHEK